jgi:hypothetical protein
MESFYTFICIFIDYNAITGIVKQKLIKTESIKRSNLLLVYTSNYFQSFNLKIMYKLGVKYIVLDVFSRL